MERTALFWGGDPNPVDSPVRCVGAEVRNDGSTDKIRVVSSKVDQPPVFVPLPVKDKEPPKVGRAVILHPEPANESRVRNEVVWSCSGFASAREAAELLSACTAALGSGSRRLSFALDGSTYPLSEKLASSM